MPSFIKNRIPFEIPFLYIPLIHWQLVTFWEYAPSDRNASASCSPASAPSFSILLSVWVRYSFPYLRIIPCPKGRPNLTSQGSLSVSPFSLIPLFAPFQQHLNRFKPLLSNQKPSVTYLFSSCFTLLSQTHFSMELLVYFLNSSTFCNLT